MALINIIIYLLSIIANLLLGIFVFWSNKKKSINQIFFLLTLSIVGWLITLFLFYTLESPKWVLWIGRINFAAVLPILYYLLRLAVIFPRQVISIPRVLKSSLAIWILVFAILIIFTPLVDEAEIITGLGKRETVYGPLYFLYILHYIAFAAVALTILFRGLRKSKEKIEKQQIEYMLWGLGLALVWGFTTNILFPLLKVYGTENYGPLAPVIFTGFVTVAIFRHHLFNIRVIAAELFTGVLVLLLFLNVFNYQSLSQLILNIAISAGVVIFGIFLIRSVLQEVRMREETEKLSRAKSEFISIASHQLRTPLTAIKGYISMILEGTYGKLAERVQKPMENVYKSNERLIKLVNDLLSVSRIEAGKMEMEWQRVSPEDIMKSVLAELKIEADKKKIKLVWEKLKKPLPRIQVDPDKIRQVFSNVIDNAIRYTHRGVVTIKSRIENRKLKIEISDTGEGMTKAELSHLFESFSRGETGAQLWTEGAGLGLYVAKKFVEMHRGEIWAESPGKGRGSTFHIELPIKYLKVL